MIYFYAVVWRFVVDKGRWQEGALFTSKKEAQSSLRQWKHNNRNKECKIVKLVESKLEGVK